MVSDGCRRKVRLFVKISDRIKLVPGGSPAAHRVLGLSSFSRAEGFRPKVPTIGFGGKKGL